MRLIDADKLDVVLRNEAKPFGNGVYDYGITDGLALARECVETAPTIDAVPVVRCRECENWEADWEPTRFDPDNPRHFCCLNDIFPTGNWFCADGQRREEKHNAAD